MQTIQEKIEWYTFLFWVYWFFSLLSVLGVFVCGVISYVTKYQEVVTVSQLFLLVLMLLLATYLRINALHYHQLVLQLQREIKRVPKPRSIPEERRPRPMNSGRAGYEK